MQTKHATKNKNALQDLLSLFLELNHKSNNAEDNKFT